MNIRRLNDAGIIKSLEFIENVAAGSEPEGLQGLLEDPRYSEELETSIQVEARSFDSRYDIAEYLFSKLSSLDQFGVERDRGLWTWLAMFYFEQLCPKKRGRRKPGAAARWIAEPEVYSRYYRHLLAGPWRIFKAHRDNPRSAMALLCTAPNKMGDIVEQIASRQDLVSNSAVVSAATTLYVDPGTNKPVRGAGGKGDGSPRRFADFLNQLDLTYDIFGMRADELVPLLPKEFDRFRERTN